MRLAYLLIIICTGLGAGCTTRQENISIGVRNATDANMSVIVVNGVPMNVRRVSGSTVTIAGSRPPAVAESPAANAPTGNSVNRSRPAERVPGTDPQSSPKPFPTGSVSTSPLPPKAGGRPPTKEEEEMIKKLKAGEPLNP